MKNKNTYHVKVLSLKKVTELPNGWSNEDYLKVLELADFDDIDQIDPSELKDYTILALQELEPDEAADIVLQYVLADKLKPGQIENLAHEMLDEKQWEEYQDIHLHKDLFNAGVLLKWAFPRKFPETYALKCVLEVKGMELSTISKSFISRLLAHGMDDHAVLNRLFDEQIAGTKFPESEGIVWQHEIAEDIITVYSSYYWLHALNETSEYQSNAYSD